jgi:hypothetical protein
MKKILVALAVVVGFCVTQPAYAGIGFGIPLPFPFLVWTPSDRGGKGNHGNCAPRDQQPNARSKHSDASSGPVGTKGS